MRPLGDLVPAIPPASKARIYFAVQAAAGGLWWLAVFASADVRRRTLGEWSPRLLVGPDLALFVGASAVAAALGSRAWSVVAATWTTVITTALTAYALIEREAGWGALLMALATVGTLAATLTLWFGQLPVQWFFVGPFAFRVAGDQSRGRHLRRSLAQLVAFWTVFFVLLPLLLSLVEQRLQVESAPLHDPGWACIGAVLFTAASALGLWSCVSMALRGEGTPLPAAAARNLVVVGPYRFVRNPMALAGVVQTLGVGLWLGSWVVMASSVVGALIWNAFIRPEEEGDLAVRFGPAYEAYRDVVRCWIPTWRPLASSRPRGRKSDAR
jgi:protein-S-isoprenylcysteine O-methyltransferase Ste14